MRRRILFAPDTANAGKAAERSPRVLIVEDDYLVASEIEAALTDAGFAVVGVAGSAAEAVQLARQETPALAIVDIRLAGRRDGVAAATEMAKELGIRSIFATAHGDAEVRERAQQASPLGWLSKPYRMENLVAMIRQALKDLKD